MVTSRAELEALVVNMQSVVGDAGIAAQGVEVVGMFVAVGIEPVAGSGVAAVGEEEQCHISTVC